MVTMYFKLIQWFFNCYNYIMLFVSKLNWCFGARRLTCISLHCASVEYCNISVDITIFIIRELG